MGRGPPGTTRRRPQKVGAVSPVVATASAVRLEPVVDAGGAVAAAPKTPNSVSTMAPSWSASAASTLALSDAGAVPSPQAAARPIRAAAKGDWTVWRIGV